MAQYLVLIYEDEAGWAAWGPKAEAAMAEHTRFGETHGGTAMVGGAWLQSASTATTIRDGVVSDGPFAETKEVLGGYYLLEAEDLDAALDLAKQIPAPFGGLEVRPIRTVG
ncbi:YciI family protein [uncultured Amnibacterium sp.]|uniref:YciI family protein n=1 Tax=uncultured Amnibacterium sp. TaxID=1631851 RepID=UPI0035CB18EF